MSSSPARQSALQLLLGAWLALGVATWFAAAASFSTSARVSAEARVTERLAGAAEAAEVLRYQAAETNRLAFTASSRAQLVLAGAAVLLAAWPPRARPAILALVASAAALSSLLGLFVVPAALRHGEALALASRPLPEDLVPVKQAMDHLHSLYSGLDLLRTGLVLVASVLLMRSAGRARATTAAALAVLVVAPGCAGPAIETPTPKTPATTEAPASAPRREAFVAELAWQHLEAIVAMGPRLDGYPGHDKFREYVARHFEGLGWVVTEQPFTYQVPGEDRIYELANVSALLGPRDEKTLLLGTHYDTRPWSDEETDPALRSRPVLGANDGGSGVAVLLEIARVLSEDPPGHGVEIVLFDGEDLGRPGFPEEYSQGAQHLVTNWSEIQGGAPYPKEVLVIDMVGDRDLEFFPEAEAMEKAPQLTSRIWQAAHAIGHGRHFKTRSARGVWDDHRPFLAADIPAALIIDLDYEPWHTVRDTLDKCSPTSLEITGQVVLEGMFPK